MIEKVRKGYKREDLYDSWERYLPPQDQPAEAASGEPLDAALDTLAQAGLITHGEEAQR